MPYCTFFSIVITLSAEIFSQCDKWCQSLSEWRWPQTLSQLTGKRACRGRPSRGCLSHSRHGDCVNWIWSQSFVQDKWTSGLLAHRPLGQGILGLTAHVKEKVAPHTHLTFQTRAARQTSPVSGKWSWRWRHAVQLPWRQRGCSSHTEASPRTPTLNGGDARKHGLIPPWRGISRRAVFVFHPFWRINYVAHVLSAGFVCSGVINILHAIERNFAFDVGCPELKFKMQDSLLHTFDYGKTYFKQNSKPKCITLNIFHLDMTGFLYEQAQVTENLNKALMSRSLFRVLMHDNASRIICLLHDGVWKL